MKKNILKVCLPVLMINFWVFGLAGTALAVCASDSECTPPATCQNKTEVTEQQCADETVCQKTGQGNCVGAQAIAEENGFRTILGHCEYTTKECVGGTEPVTEMFDTAEKCFIDEGCKTTPGGKCENVGMRKNDDASWTAVPGAPGYCIYPYIGAEIKFQPTVPTLLINIPTFKGFSNAGVSAADEEGYLYPPFIGQYFGAIYKWAILVGALIATIMIMFGGMMYLLSAGNPTKIEEAKSRITSALLGLFLLLGSYTLLYLINPDLVKFKSLKILAIQPEYVGEDDPAADDMDSGDAPAGNASAGAGAVLIPTTNYIKNSQQKQARPDVVAALQKAIEEYAGDVSINDGQRTAAGQWAAVKKNCKCKNESEIPNDVSPGQWQPYCTALSGCRAAYKKLGRQGGNFTYGATAGHFVGNALDMNATGGSYTDCQNASNEVRQSNGVVKISGVKYVPCIPKNQQFLIKAMINAGFCVGLKSGSSISESWHFELTGNGVPLSPFCTKDLNDSNLQKLYYLQNEP